MAKVIITIEVDEQGGVTVQTPAARAVAAAPDYVAPTSEPASGIQQKRLGASFSQSLAGNSASQGAGPSAPTGSGLGSGPPVPTGSGLGGGPPVPTGSGLGGGPPVPTGSGLGGGSSAPTESGLSSGNGTFRIQHQQQIEWCWAAVAVSVEKYFDSASTMTQCRIAGDVTGQSCCGVKGASDRCNQAELLQPALESVNRLKSVRNRSLQFSEVQREIDAGRPVAAHIQWQSGQGHFVVLDGYRILPGAVHLHVSDPLNPSSEVDFDEFTNNYQGDGTWNISYLVKS